MNRRFSLRTASLLPGMDVLDGAFVFKMFMTRSTVSSVRSGICCLAK